MSRVNIVVLWLVLAACDAKIARPLEVSGVDVFAPLPGSQMSAAYMTFANHTDQPIVVESISSPDFDSVELHESRIIDGISSMHALVSLTIPARSTVTLEEGGIHMMLMQPIGALELDHPVRLQVNYDSNGIVIVNAVLRSRFRPIEHR